MALAYDFVYWEEDSNGDLRPRTTAVDIGYPEEDEVEFGVTYGYEDQYTGTLSGGGPVPSTPSLRILSNLDGTATATISNSDDDAVNTVWVFLRHNGVLELLNAGSRTGDGQLGLDSDVVTADAEYIGYVISTRDYVNSMPSNPDSFFTMEDVNYAIRNNAAEAELQIAKLAQFGVLLIFQNGKSATPVSVYGTMSGGMESLQLRDSIRTNIENVEFNIPRQTAFPPAKFNPGATITLQKEQRVYEIDTIESSNSILERSSSFRCICGNYRWLDSAGEEAFVVGDDESFVVGKPV